jgi:hypothetical protein
MIYLVVMDRGGLYGIYYDLVLASRTAQAINGAVCELSILEDHREPPGQAGSSS